jgi:hypothetical protein
MRGHWTLDGLPQMLGHFAIPEADAGSTVR